jgi:hypothetical protein
VFVFKKSIARFSLRVKAGHGLLRNTATPVAWYYFIVVSLLRRVPFEVRLIIGLFLATRIVLTVVGVAARAEPANTPNSPFMLQVTGRPVWDIWAVFDARWYLDIARLGYAMIPGRDTSPLYPYAFPPLYPLLIRALAPVAGGAYPAALVVSNAALLGSAFLLHGYVRRRWGPDVAHGAVTLLFLSPVGFLLSGVLSESLFLFLAVAALSAADRSRWWLAALLAGLATVTRLVGLALIVPLALELLRQRPRHTRSYAWLLLAPLPLLAFLLYSAYAVGDPLAPLHAHGLPPWYRHFMNPLFVLLNGLTQSDDAPRIWAVTVVLELTALAFAARRIGTTLTITGVLLVLFPLSTGLMSALRLSVVQFPIAIFLALVIRKSHYRWMLYTFSVVLQIAFMTLWTTADQVLV